MDQASKNKEADRIIGLLSNEILSHQRISFLLFRQFLIGIAYGLGASIGAAIIGTALIYVYRNTIGGFIKLP